MIKQITHYKQLLSIIVRDGYRKEAISFFTPDEFSQQFAFMLRVSPLSGQFSQCLPPP